MTEKDIMEAEIDGLLKTVGLAYLIILILKLLGAITLSWWWLGGPAIVAGLFILWGITLSLYN